MSGRLRRGAAAGQLRWNESSAFRGETCTHRSTKRRLALTNQVLRQPEANLLERSALAEVTREHPLDGGPGADESAGLPPSGRERRAEVFIALRRQFAATIRT